MKTSRLCKTAKATFAALPKRLIVFFISAQHFPIDTSDSYQPAPPGTPPSRSGSFSYSLSSVKEAEALPVIRRR